MSWGRCQRCQHWDWLDRHTCLPAFYVYDVDEGDAADAAKYHAIDHEAAAEQYAEDDDSASAECAIISGNPARVMVRRSGEDEWHPYTVSGEAVPRYDAREGHKEAGR